MTEQPEPQWMKNKRERRAAQAEWARKMDVRDCLIAYRNAYDAEDGEQLGYANRLYSAMDTKSQSEIIAILSREYPRTP